MKKSMYAAYVSKKAARSSLFRDCLLAFLIGGGICCLGQFLFTWIYQFSADDRMASGFTSIALIFLSCLFTGIGWYDKLASYAGAGTLVPITGFANAMSSPAIDNTAEGMVMGLGAKIFVICGPVILYGCVFSVILGLIAYLLRIFGIDITGVV